MEGGSGKVVADSVQRAGDQRCGEVSWRKVFEGCEVGDGGWEAIGTDEEGDAD